MNVKETKTILSMVWTMYPNAPKLDANERQGTVLSWFGCLHSFSAADVWNAILQATEEQPRFIPSAPEIKKRCKKTLDNYELFASDEYFEVKDKIKELREFLAKDFVIMNEEFPYKFWSLYTKSNAITAEQKAVGQEVFWEYRGLLEKLETLKSEALQKAEDAYDFGERVKIADDGNDFPNFLACDKPAPKQIKEEVDEFGWPRKK